jgi:hypothetical protein
MKRDSKTENEPAKVPPAYLPGNAAQLIMAAADAFSSLLSKAPDEVQSLSFALFEAALIAMFHGERGVGKALAKRAVAWNDGKRKRAKAEASSFRTTHAVKHSKLPKSRGTRGKNAFEEAAEQLGIAPSTAEKRRYRKPK